MTPTPQSDEACFFVQSSEDGKLDVVPYSVARDIESENVEWERWAKLLLTDFKRPFDDHPEGLRNAISRFCCEFLSEWTGDGEAPSTAEGAVEFAEKFAPEYMKQVGTMFPKP